MKKNIFFLFFILLSFQSSAKKYKVVVSPDIKSESVFFILQENICNKLNSILKNDDIFSPNLIFEPTATNIDSKLGFINDFGSDIIIVISCYHTPKYSSEGTSCFVFGKGDYGDNIIKNIKIEKKISDKSIMLSKYILYNLSKNGRIVKKDINYGNFAMLSSGAIGVVINIGVPNNFDDLSYLKSSLGQDLIVNSIYKGISEYIKFN